jgi:anti-sigma B factor antagonist
VTDLATEPQPYRSAIFAVAAEPDGGAMRVRASGELDVASVPHLEGAVSASLAAGGRVVLDLSGLTFIDSTGVKLVLRAIASAEDDAALAIVAPPPLVMRTFELLELTPLLEPHLRAA